MIFPTSASRAERSADDADQSPAARRPLLPDAGGLRPVSAPAPWSKAIFPQAETANEWTTKLPDPLQPPRLRQPRQGHSSAGVAAGLVHRVVVGHALAERTPPPRPGVGEVGRPQQR